MVPRVSVIERFHCTRYRTIIIRMRIIVWLRPEITCPCGRIVRVCIYGTHCDHAAYSAYLVISSSGYSAWNSSLVPRPNPLAYGLGLVDLMFSPEKTWEGPSSSRPGREMFSKHLLSRTICRAMSTKNGIAKLDRKVAIVTASTDG